MAYQLPGTAIPFGAPRPRPASSSLPPALVNAITPQYAPPEQESNFSLGSSVISGLAGVGNFLDLATGASSVRDIVSGFATGDWNRYNPVDQFLTPFSHENRATGRDVLANMGLTTYNDPNKWEWSDVGGLATEIALDPAAWPASLFGLGGRSAKAAAKFGPQYDRVAARATEVFGDEAKVGLDLMKQHAQKWAESTGKNADDWFERIQDIQHSDPSQVGSGALYQLGVKAPGQADAFYSKIHRLIDEGKISDNIGRQQLESTLRNNGVKAEEITDLGLDNLYGAGKALKVSDLDEAVSQKLWGDLQETVLDGSPGMEPSWSSWTLPDGVPGSYREMLLRDSNINYPPGHHTDPDVFAHVRFDDIVGPDGQKILRIQEVQSDLHQGGRARGYAPSADQIPRYSGQVPDAPFKKSWQDLALKRMLRYAAENGYEKVAVADGRAMAEVVGGPAEQLGKWYDRLAETVGSKTAKYGGESSVLATGERVFGIPQSMADDLLSKGQPLYQTGKGAVDFLQNGKAIVHAFGAADISTLAHETGHIFRRSIGELDSTLLKQAENALGVADGKWTREAEEAFASGFERYLRDGQAPNSALKQTFEKFKEFLTGIYRSITGTPLEQSVSPQLKQIFDDMLTPTSITQAGGLGRFGGASLAGVGHGVLYNMAKGATPDFVKQSSTVKAISDATEGVTRTFNRMFDSSVKGRVSAPGQEAARSLYAKELATDQYVRSEVFPMLTALKKMGALDDEAARLHRDLLEGIAETTGTAADDVLAQASRQSEEVLQRLQDLGRDPGELLDVISHSYRSMGAEPAQAFAKQKWSGKDGRPLGTHNPQDTARREVWKGFKGGTNQVNEVLTDPTFGDIIKANAGKPAKAKKLIAERMAEKYGDDIEQFYQATNSEGMLRFKIQGENGTKALTRAQVESMTVDLGDGTRQFTSMGKLGKGPEVNLILEPIMVNRYEKLAAEMVKLPELREKGLFTNHWLWDHYNGIRSAHLQADAIDTTYDLLNKPGVITGSKPKIRKSGEKFFTFGDLFKEMRVNGDKAAMEILKRRGMQIPDDPAELSALVKEVKRWTIRDDIVEDIRMPWAKAKIPSELDGPSKIANSLTAMWKAGVLTAPARYVRDLMSGMIRNWENGWFDIQSGVDAHKLLQGGIASGWEKVPQVQAWLQRTGREATPENASDALREMYASMKATPVFRNTDTGVEIADRGGIDTLLGEMRGLDQATVGSNVRDFLRAATGRAENTNLNPMNIRGVSPLGFKGPGMRGAHIADPIAETSFGPVVAGDMVGRYTDDMNRFVPFLNQLRRDQARPVEAIMNDIMHAQVDYSPRAFTKTEQFLKKFLPFYSFSSRQFPYIAKKLWQEPGGKLAGMIRGSRLGQGDPESGTPDYVASTTSVPLWKGDDGTQKYLTGLGLMHEDPLTFLQWNGDSQLPSLRDFLGETVSRSTPFAKAPIEWATGESFFQRGPMGGRDLEDMDPLIGRLVSNVSELTTGNPIEQANGRAYPLGFMPGSTGDFAEHVVANSPISRILSTARQATDKRKYDAGPVPALANILTGVRISDVSPQSQEATKRERLQAFLKSEYGAKKYEKIYFSKEQIEKTRESDPVLAGQMEQANKEFSKRPTLKKKAETKSQEKALSDKERFMQAVQKRRENLARSAG